jgi:hypothetical protein
MESQHPEHQMILKRFLIVSIGVVGIAAFLEAQPTSEPTLNTQPTFREHRIGESAQEFFSIASVAERNGMLSTDYCRSYRNDPKMKQAIEKASKKSAGDPSSLAAKTAEGCSSIQAALAGQDVEVDALFAAEFVSGQVRFVAGHLASATFIVKAPFNDVVEDMTAKLNATPRLDAETFQNSVAAIVKQRRAVWTLPKTLVKLSELRSLEGSDIGTEVSVSDPEMTKRRTNSLN